MASLYLGRRIDAPDDAPPVAIKVIHKHLAEDWQFVRMFVDEALISVRLRHPNVIRVDELGEVDGVYFLAMEYVHGCSLADLLRQMGRARRRMRPELAIHIACEVLKGLHAAHEMVGHDGQLLGIVHRDVSPQNVLLGVDGRVVLLDFGIAKAQGRAERTEAGVIKGKVRYMAPEQAGADQLDRRVDVYALGVMLWECLTMRRYIEGRNEIELIRRVREPVRVPPSSHVPGLAPEVEAAVMAALEPHRDARPPTADALRALLHASSPAPEVGPGQVADLLRVFVADEIAEAARALPREVGASIERHLETTRPAIEERTRTLTVELPADDDGAPDEPTRERALPAANRDAVTSAGKRAPPPEDMRATLKQGMPEVSPEDIAAALPSFEEDEDEATVQASGAELAELYARMQDQYGVRDAARAPPPTAPPAIAPPAASPAPAADSGRAMRWALIIFGITAVAFGLGAAVAVLWVRVLR